MILRHWIAAFRTAGTISRGEDFDQRRPLPRIRRKADTVNRAQDVDVDLPSGSKVSSMTNWVKDLFKVGKEREVSTNTIENPFISTQPWV